MTGTPAPVQDLECALLWKLARQHGWGETVPVPDLVRDANVENERTAREVARHHLAKREAAGYHNGRDTIWLRGPPGEDVVYYLRDECGYAELQIEATFDSYFDGF